MTSPKVVLLSRTILGAFIFCTLAFSSFRSVDSPFGLSVEAFDIFLGLRWPLECFPISVLASLSGGSPTNSLQVVSPRSIFSGILSASTLPLVWTSSSIGWSVSIIRASTRSSPSLSFRSWSIPRFLSWVSTIPCNFMSISTMSLGIVPSDVSTVLSGVALVRLCRVGEEIASSTSVLVSESLT